MEQCVKVGTFGLNRKHLLGKVEPGDKLVCCAGKGDWKIVGLGTVSGAHYVDDSKIFLSDGLFPDRFDFSAERLASDAEVNLMTIIDDLSFVTNVAYWAVYFRNGIVEMTKDDWQLVTSKISSKPVSTG